MKHENHLPKSWIRKAWSTHSVLTSNETNADDCVKQMPWDCLSTYTSAFIYIGFVVGMFVFGLVRAWSLYAVGVRSSKALHNRMYHSVVRAPIRFHDTNPKGNYGLNFLLSINFFSGY